jgi:hypothetical protein
MEPTSDIFDLEFKQLYAKYSKRIITGKVMLFITSGIIFAALAIMIVISFWEHDDPVLSGLIIFATPGAAFLLLGIYSFRNSFLSLLISSVILGLIFLYGFTAFIDWSDQKDIFTSSCFILILSVLLFFTVRGAVFAWKKKKLIIYL